MDLMKGKSEPVGYTHPLYALSLQEFGDPRELHHCGAWVLERSISGTPYKDAMGCYPLFLCRDWSKIGDDLEDIKSELVSLVLITDPFSQLSYKYFEKYFDIVKPFKTHFIINLSYPLENFVDKMYAYKARRSLKQMEIEICLEPTRYLDDWIKLYDNLIKRHSIRGISVFSPKCFAIQLQIPGTILIIGKADGEVVGAKLIIVQNNVAYSHLTAFSPRGYKIRASYGIYWTALKYLADQGIKYYDMGGGAGIKEDLEDGLNKFKAGWSNDRRMVYLCGRVLNDKKYEFICQQRKINKGDYFPVYRGGEFV